VTELQTRTKYAYDASGNMKKDGVNTLVYDAVNRAISASGSLGSGTYSYDGNNLRVQKCIPNCTSPTTTTVYVFSGSKVIAEYDNGASVTSPTREYIYSGGTLLAKVDSSGTKYYHQDMLSNRVVTDASGAKVAELGHFPFGESWYNSTGDKLLFTSYERDSESGNDYAQARYHVNRLARFSSTDPVAGSVGDPQSLDLYAYVRNDPISSVDPTGMFLISCSSSLDPSFCRNGGGGGGTGAFGGNCDGLGFGDDSDMGSDWLDGFGDFSGIDSCGGPFDGIGPLNWGPHLGGGVSSLADYKRALANLLKNPDCAKLIGGQDVAGTVLDGIARIVDVSPGSGFTPYGQQDKAAAANVNDNGFLASNTSINGANGVWNGFGFAIVGGSDFVNNSFGAQLTIIIHEMIHVGYSGTPMGSRQNGIPAFVDLDKGGKVSAARIARDCGTESPQYAPWQNEPTTMSPIPITLQ
jgi:RHS repeat-associated protein